MDAEKLVSSIETCKQLQAAGWKKETCLYWYDMRDGVVFVEKKYYSEGQAPYNELSSYRVAPAPTFQEIWDELSIDEKYTDLHLCLVNENNGNSTIGFASEEDGYFYEKEENNNLAEAAAQLWLWCVENGHIKVGE